MSQIKITEDIIAVEVPAGSTDVRVNKDYDFHQQLEYDGSFIDLEPFVNYQYMCLASEVKDNILFWHDYDANRVMLDFNIEYALLKIIK